MNEQDFARGVARQLDAAADRLPARVLSRLRVTRELAMTRARAVEPSLAASAAGLAGGWPLTNPRLLISAAALIFATLGLVYWQQVVDQSQPARYAEPSDIVDAEVLTDDLPVVAYLDPGFEIWLYHHTPSPEAP